jgi:transposase-like protein
MKVTDLVRFIRDHAPFLNRNQKKQCLAALEMASNDGDTPVPLDIPAVLRDAKPECCPHCKSAHLIKWGFASGLRRWCCRKCRKTFNILTKTPLTRLRKREKWMDNARAMIAGKTVRDTAKDCGVHRNTSFRWRHRFLQNHKRAQHANLKGIAESDATYFYRSEKGSKTLVRKPRKRGGDGIPRGMGPHLVPVVTLRDRSGKGADRVATENLTQHATDLYRDHLAEDTLLITGGDPELCAAAKKRNPQAHLPLPGEESRGCGKSPFHIQTTNAFHSNFKSWMRRFNGVATKYLANYAGWYRHLAEGNHKKDPGLFILLSFNPLSVCQQLMVT